ncbi:MAG: hypothetical protein E7464_00210 [Ruminococcaceae bacterium]|nr:hypothetical protein [Oscillospiraceae bacterium]
MVFNNEINRLKLWCGNRAEEYLPTQGSYGGIASVGYHLMYDLIFKLSTLMDRPFESKAAFREAILGMLDIHYEPCILEPQNNTARHMIEKTNRGFCAYLDEVLSEPGISGPVEIPYRRVIVGDEAKGLIEKFRTVWGYVNTCCWFPLMGNEPEEIKDKFYIMYDYLEPYHKELEKLLGLPQTHIYSYGETVFYPEHCEEVVEMVEYGGCESIYTDKDFSWAVYFSHEDTVAFAGSIVPKVKELLWAEQEHWDKFEWGID